MSFGVVRNPWDKMVSNYAFFIEQEDKFRNDQIESLFGVSRHNISFDRFLGLAARLPNHHWAECHKFFPKLPNGEIDLDCVVRFERFVEDIQAIGTALGIDLNIEYRNQTSHRPYRGYYTRATRSQVASMFEGDIAYFGYSF